MSFSGDVKKELIEVLPKRTGEARAELAGIAAILAEGREDGRCLVYSDSEELQRKFFTLLKKTFNIRNGETEMLTEGRRSYFTVEADGKAAGLVGGAVSSFSADGSEKELKAFLRGAFLAAGSISNPKRFYHLEIVCRSNESARKVLTAMENLGLSARMTERKGSFVVYIKEAENISLSLGLMGAGRAYMEFENIRIVREMRGTVNRKVNCETANMRKTIEMSLRQREDCEYLKEKGVLGTLKRQLREMAEVRLANPDETTLEDLGKLLDPPIGKSGVNHRLKKLHEAAESLREKEGNIIQAESL